MSIRIDNKPLQKALATVMRAISAREGVESHALCTVRGDMMFITCVSPAMALSTRMQVRADADASFTLPARKVYDIARKHSDDAIWSIALDGLKLKIAVGRARYVLNALPEADFPKPQFLGKEHHRFIVDSGALSDLVNAVLPSAGKNDVRMALNSVNVVVSQGHLHAVATDGHRLSHAARPTAVGGDAAEYEFLLPRAVAQEVAGLGDHGVTAGVYLKANQFQCKVGDTFLVAKSMSDRYPDWRSVMPKDFTGSVRLDRERFVALLRSVSTVVDEKRRAVTLKAERGSLVVETPGASENSAIVAMDAETAPIALESSLNIDYLLEAVSAISADAVDVSFGDTNHPSLIHGAGTDTSLRTIIMPMR